MDSSVKKACLIRCAIWFHLYNLKNVKNTDGGVLLLDGCFSRFSNVQMVPNRATHHKCF